MKVYEAINRVAAEMATNGIGKGRRNQQQGYNFRGIDDVLNALSAALSKAGLVILPRCTERVCVERQSAKGGALFYVTCRVEFDMVASEDGSKHTVCTYGEAMDSADKATNKAMSAAYKYMALLAFCIPVEASPDNDADFTTHDVKTIEQDFGMDPKIIADWLRYISEAIDSDDLIKRSKDAKEAAQEVKDREAYVSFTTATKEHAKKLGVAA